VQQYRYPAAAYEVTACPHDVLASDFLADGAKQGNCGLFPFIPKLGAIQAAAHVPKEVSMTTMQITLDIPQKLAREAQAAGLLTPKGIQLVLKEAMRRKAGEALIAAANRAGNAGGRAPSMATLVAEVKSVRTSRNQLAKRQLGRLKGIDDKTFFDPLPQAELKAWKAR
jgi:hypothetical protein